MQACLILINNTAYRRDVGMIFLIIEKIRDRTIFIAMES